MREREVTSPFHRFLAWAACGQWCLSWAGASDGQLSGLGRAGLGCEMLSSASDMMRVSACDTQEKYLS